MKKVHAITISRVYDNWVLVVMEDIIILFTWDRISNMRLLVIYYCILMEESRTRFFKEREKGAGGYEFVQKLNKYSFQAEEEGIMVCCFTDVHISILSEILLAQKSKGGSSSLTVW